MTIGIIFSYGSEIVEVRVQSSNCFFRTSQIQHFTTIEGLKLDKRGVLKEFPDLKDNENWKKEAINKFKNKMKELTKEEERIKYIIDDLSKFGYVPLMLQKQGYRPIKLNEK